MMNRFLSGWTRRRNLKVTSEKALGIFTGRFAPFAMALGVLYLAPCWSQIQVAPDSGSAQTSGSSGAQISRGVQLDNAPGTASPGLGSNGSGSNLGANGGSGGIGSNGSGEDLLSQLDRNSGKKPSLFSKLKRLLGAGGSPGKRGANAYASGDYDQALQNYAEAQLDQPESQALAYNMGDAQFRKKKYDDAIKEFKKALHGDDASIAAKAYYNLGNAQFRKGEFAIQGGHQEGIEDYREAMASYKKSLEIAPDNKDAKRNIEVVQARIKELLDRQKQDQKQQQNGQKQPPPEPSEKAKDILARAMQLVQQRRYAEAKSMLEAVIQSDKTAVTYQSFVQRIDDVLKILRGETPTPPQGQDPRAQQPGVGVI